MEHSQTEQHGRLEQLVAYRVVDSAAIGTLAEQVRVMASQGCAVGREQGRRIGELEKLPAKVLGTVATLGSIAGIIGGGIVWLIKVVTGGGNQ
jgi:hypothetical protein